MPLDCEVNIEKNAPVRLLLNGCYSASPSTSSICTIKSKTDAWEAALRLHRLFLPVYNSSCLEFLMKIIP